MPGITLAGEVHVRGARRRLDLSFSPDRREVIVLDDERGVVDRGTAVAGNEPSAFVNRRAR
jgi:hypothetical protein